MNTEFCAIGDTEDERLVRDSVRRLLSHHWSEATAFALTEQPGALANIWRRGVGQGWATIAPTDDPVVGLSAALVLQQELGRASCPLPLMDAVLTNMLLAGVPDSRAQTLLERLHSGEICVTWAWGPGSGEKDAFSLRLSPAKTPTQLHGCVAYVENASTASHLLVFTGRPEEIAVIPLDAPGIIVKPTPGLARPALSEVRVDAVERFELLYTACPLESFGPVARLLLASRALGAAAYGLELLIDYAKTRVQFGKRIGQYQAIQHKLADCFINLEICRLTLARAGRAGVTPGRSAFEAHVASANAGQSLREVVQQSLHGFGGIAFWEGHAMPQLFRSVHSDLIRLGGVRVAQCALGAELLESPVGTYMPDPDLGNKANAFRQEVRDWLKTHWDQTYPEETKGLPINHRNARQSFSRKLGRKGWLGVSWPRQYGGQNRTALEQLVFEEEMAYAEAPVTFHNTAVNMIGPALIVHGSTAQKEYFLPRIAAGDISIALGYSEPDHGSDLAGIRTAATRNADGTWSVQGQKTFTSTAGFSTHLWLAARTDPANQRQGGISVFLVRLNTPGITLQPMIGLNGHRANIVFLDEVQVPADALVGEVNGGWKVIISALAYERATLAGIAARARGYFDRLVDYVRSSRRELYPYSLDSSLLERIGALSAEIEAARLLALQTAEAMDRGEVPVYQAAMSKVYSSELMERLAETAFDLFGTGTTLQGGESSALIGGCFEYAVRDALLYVIGGGTNEIQRTLIAQRGLGLPR